MEKFTGWKTILGRSYWMKDGLVIRTVIEDGGNHRPGYIYRLMRDGRTWTSVTPTEAALRAGLRRGTYCIQ